MADDQATKTNIDTSIYWRTIATVRLKHRLRVVIEIGEPCSEKNTYEPAKVIDQAVTLARLGRMLRKIAGGQ